MNVLVDYHHGNLLYSLYLLLEKRLGWKMYRPIGLDWFTQGYWKIAEPYGNAQDTINQYLATDDRTWDAYSALNGGSWKEEDIYRIKDLENNFIHRAITFEKFKEMEFDLIIATHPLHNNWGELIQFQPKAKFVMQLGNEGQTTNAVNVLCSNADFQPQSYQNFIRYRQEFDLTDYKYESPTNHNKITSFVVSLPEPETYEKYKSSLPEFEFKAYGVGSPDGTVSGNTISQRMKENAFGWHIKPADGYGHVIHKWFACGRPIITRASYYKGKMAEPLIIDGITAIDLDKRSFEDNIAFIKEMAKPENHFKMCVNAFNRFREVVNFDKEAQEVQVFLENLR